MVALPQRTWDCIDSISQASRANGEDPSADHNTVLFNLVMSCFALMEQVDALAEPAEGDELNLAHSGGTVETKLRLVNTRGMDPHNHIEAEAKKKEEKDEG